MSRKGECLLTDTYSTVQGDTWDLIAWKIYGDESLMSLLLEANPSHAETAIFPAGVALLLPDVPEDTSNLPPWKR
jgi:phage tail protein X